MLENYKVGGTGRLEFPDDMGIECTFLLHQHFDGALFLRCDCSGDDVAAKIRLAFSAWKGAPLRLIGQTAAGESTLTVGPLHVVEINAADYTLRATRVIIGDENSAPTEQRFVLTNVSFPENGGQDMPPPVQLSIPILGEPTSVILKPHDEYQERNRLQRLHRLTAPTAILIVANGPSISETSKVVGRLCTALSIVQGSKVNWITHECLDENHTSRYSSLENRITKAPSSLALNRVGGNNKLLPLTAVHDCFARICELEEQYAWNRVLEVWLEARENADYTETRALRLVTVIEALRTIILRHKPQQPPIAKPEWDAFLRYIIPVTDFYATAGLKLKQDQISVITTPERWNRLNERSFRSAIGATFKILGIKEDVRAIELFVQSRNKLIHEGMFRCQSEPEEVVAEMDAPKDPTAEYFFIASFVDRVIMKTVGLKRYLDAASEH